MNVLATDNDKSGNHPECEDLIVYKLMFEMARDMIFIYSKDGRIIDVNNLVVDSYGYSREELLTMNIADLRTPAERPKVMKQTEQCCAGPCLFETVHQRKDGSIFPVEITASCIFPEREILAAIVRNATERKKVEKALEKSRAILARAQEIAHIGNWAWDIKGNTMQWSDELYRIFGFRPGEFQPAGDWFVRQICPEDRERFEKMMSEAVEKDKLFNADFPLIRPDGVHRYINFVADRIRRDKAGSAEWMYGIIQDITSRKEIENQLREAQSQVELYIELMSHDINNMNMAALGFLEMAHSKLETEGRLDKSDLLYVEKPIENIENSSRLISNVRKLQRAKDGELVVKPIDLAEVLDSVKAQYIGIPNRDVKISLVVCCHCTVMANDLLRDLFSNLVGNSIKHSSGPLLVNILLSCVEKNGRPCCQVVVEDNGPGIPDVLKSQIFDRSGEIKKWHGRGLGLYIVRTLVADFKGAIRVEDRVSGDYTKGVRFVVSLPAART